MKLLLWFTFLFCLPLLGENLEILAPKEEPTSIGYLYIGGHDSQISQGTFIYIKNALEKFKELRPAFIILELDTPGGELFASQKISDALKEIDIQYGIPVVAVINNWAISGGAMLAYSCRFIAVVKDGSMGAAQPVSSSSETPSEKINSAVRTDFAGRAAFFDRNPAIAEAMVDPDVILVSRDGKVIKLGNESDIQKEDRVLKREGKLLTLSSEEMIELNVADMRLLPTKLEPVTKEERTEGSWPASKELLMTAPFFTSFSNATIYAAKKDWKTTFFSILSSPAISSFLFLALVIFGYLEFSTPGFGLPGILAIIALFLIILAHFATAAASYLEVILLLVGILLILVEVFVFPSFGILGILGGILSLWGLLTLLLPGLSKVDFDFNTHTFNAAGQYVLERTFWLGAMLVLGFILISILAKFLTPKLRLYSPLVLRDKEGSLNLSEEALPRVGSGGVAFSPLRTAGKVIIKDEIYDAISSGCFIDKGEKIKVIKIEGNKMIVEEVK